MKAYLAAGDHTVDPACFFLSVDKPWMAKHGLIAWPGPDGKESLFSTIVRNPCVALGPIARDHLLGGFRPGVVYEVDVPKPLVQSPTSSWTNLRDLGIATMTLQPDGTVVVAPYVAPAPRPASRTALVLGAGIATLTNLEGSCATTFPVAGLTVDGVAANRDDYDDFLSVSVEPPAPQLDVDACLGCDYGLHAPAVHNTKVPQPEDDGFGDFDDFLSTDVEEDPDLEDLLS